MNEMFSHRSKQLCRLLFLCLAVDMAVRPFTARGPAAAQRAIPAAILNTAAVCLLLGPLRSLYRRGALGTLQGKTAPGKLFLVLGALLFTLAGAFASLRTEAFFRYVSDEPTPQLLFYAIVLLAVFHALRCGQEALVRVTGLLFWVFLAGMALMLLSNAGSMHLFRLAADPFDPPGVLETAARGFMLPPELLLIFVFSRREQGERRFPLGRTLAFLGVFYMLLTFCTQAVLGPSAQNQTQTVHTLSRLGSISVFRRLDAMHIAVWVLAELCRIAALACGASEFLAALLGEKRRAFAAPLAVALMAGAAFACSGRQPDCFEWILTAGTALLMLYWILYSTCGRKRTYAKKNG